MRPIRGRAGSTRSLTLLWLSRLAGDGGIKQLARKVDGAVCSLCASLCDVIQPALQQAAHLLGQLQGLAMSATRLGNLGLQASPLSPPHLLAHSCIRFD